MSKHKNRKRDQKVEAQSIDNQGDRNLSPSKTKKDNSPQVWQRDKINWELRIRERGDLTDKQKSIIDLILDKETKVVFLSGPAGVAKTWLAVYCGLHLLNQHRLSHVTYLRTIIESASRSLGYLAGDFSQKMEPYLMPMMDKLDELVSKEDSKRLLTDKRFIGAPVNFLRGASFNAQYIICDESQNATEGELITIMTRLGPYSKLIILGDPDQSDIAHSGFMSMFDLFNEQSSKDKGIHCVSLTKDDIVRSGVVRHIVERIEWYRSNRR